MKQKKNNPISLCPSGEPLTIGIPRALLYPRQITMWKTFFEELGMKIIVSPPTNRRILENGTKAAIDEMCLAVKIYLGHVEELAGRCDMVLVPRIVDYGIRRNMCTTFEGLPDIVRNIFRNRNLQILSYSVDVQCREKEEAAFLDMAHRLGIPFPKAKRAYRNGLKAMENEIAGLAKKTEALYRQKDRLRVAVAGHSYVIEDEYIGKPVLDALRSLGVLPIRSDLVNRKKARATAQELSPTLKWELSKELAGSLAMHIDDLDGIILLSCYPCALDSMVNEMIIRKAYGKRVPILQLTLDAQSGTAGMETRLESFIDILRMNHGETADRLDEEAERQAVASCAGTDSDPGEGALS